MRKAILVFALYVLVGGFAGSVVAFVEPSLDSLAISFVLGVPFGIAGGLHAMRIHLKQQAL
jgi:hypothetical protein